MTTLAQTIGRRETTQSSLITDAILVVAGSLFVALLAQLSFKLPFTPVPITGQTLGVLLVGGALGSIRGAASLALYLVWIVAGLPFGAEGQGGADLLALSSATGGYLIGFVVAAFVVGRLAEMGWDRTIGSAIGAFLIGEIIIFGIGVPWLAGALDIPVQATGACDLSTGAGCDALELGLYPFVLGDLLKVFIAAAALPAAWKLVDRGKGPKS